jgi:hypothetical protein
MFIFKQLSSRKNHFIRPEMTGKAKLGSYFRLRYATRSAQNVL